MRIRSVIIAGFSVLAGVIAASAAEIRVPAEPGALALAIDSSRPGDVLRLAPGRHDGPVTIDRALTLVGDENARVTGPGLGSVIAVTAADVTISNLIVSGSGTKLNELDSGIVISAKADRARIKGNRIVGNLIGVDVQGGKDATVAGNVITGRDDLRRPEMGPGIYVWNAPGLLVEDNDISRGRDGVFITTSSKAVYRNNRFSELRFALHSMYANQIEVADNRSTDNDMGFAFMYSRQLDIHGNLSVGDRTHGIFMNFVNRAVISHNEVRDGGEKCLFVYNSNKNRIADNLFEGCDIGIHFTAGSEGNDLTGNAFLGNRTQVKNVGTRWLEWSEKGRGNYWSDHVAFDIDGDGIADSPYRPNDSIDRIVWSQPSARLLLGSPAVQLIRWSQSRFPGLLPGGVIDSRPLASPQGAGSGQFTEKKEGQS